jgi:hypothetical protein
MKKRKRCGSDDDREREEERKVTKMAKEDEKTCFCIVWPSQPHVNAWSLGLATKQFNCTCSVFC